MKPYQHYKSSGIDWIGKIPEHWKVCRFRNFIKQCTQPSTSERKIGLENIESATGRFICTTTEFEGNGVAFEKNDIIYGKLRPYLQKVWLAEFSGNVVGDSYVFRCYMNSNPQYIKYLLLSSGFTKVADGSTFGAKMPRVSASFILNLKYFLPPLSEQEAIAEYLDRKCGEIDRMTGKYERQIVLLKELKQSVISKAVTQGLNPQAPLRPSGIDWIGKIPEHWGIKKLKFVCTLSPKVNIKEKKCDIEVTFLPMENIRNGFFIPNQTSLKNYVSSYNLFEEGDILVAKVTPCFENGNIVIANNLTNGMGFASSEIFVFRVNTNDTKFVFYYFQNGNFKDRAVSSMTGSAGLRRIPAPFLMNEFIPVPPLSEQAVIVEYLDRKCGEIDGMIGRIERKIELLRELRKTLISEAVTGKIDVREEVAR